jgi:hypothetical protein
MAKQARDASSVSDLHVVADRGYFTGNEVLACHEASITTYLPKPKTSPNQAKGMFPREAFRYVPERNEYRCPARERLIWRFKNIEKGQTPDIMRIRRQTVEHLFGTLEAWMGATHFLTKGLKNVGTEMSLHVLAYNMKRVMNILGSKGFIQAM